MQEVGQSGLKLSDFYGQVAADNAVNNYIQKSTALLRGDPNSGPLKNPDGTPVAGPGGGPVYGGGYFSQRGADAMAGFKNISQELDESLQETRQSLQTPMAQKQFDTEARRYRAQYANEMGEHYDQQFQAWTKDTASNSLVLGQNQVVNNLGNDAALSSIKESMRNAAVKLSQSTMGASDPAAQTAGVLHADQLWATTQIKGWIEKDPSKAQEVLDANRNVLGSMAKYDALNHQVNEAVFQQKAYSTVQQRSAAELAQAQHATYSAPAAQDAVTDLLGPVQAPVAKGPIYDQIAKTATAHGATPDDIDFLKREAYLESSGNPKAQNGQSTGLFQFHPDTAAKVGITNLADTDQQIAGALALKNQNAAALAGTGVQPTGANLYLMHQQGAAGGKALLTAPPEISAVAALTPSYETNGRTPEQAQAIATKAVVNNGGTADMTAGQFVDHWTRKWNGGAAAAEGAAPDSAGSVTGNLERMTPQVDADAQKEAETLFPDNPYQQARYVDLRQNAHQKLITQQKQVDDANLHTVQAALVGDGISPPTTPEEVRAQGPAQAAAWDALPPEHQATAIREMLSANARGMAGTYGIQASTVLDHILAPDGDPAQIKDVASLWGMVNGKSKDAPLTNSGVKALAPLLALRGTPQGEATITQLRNFFNFAKGQISISDPRTGVVDRAGDAQLDKFMVGALGTFQSELKAGTSPAEMFNPTSPHYVGRAMGSYAPSPLEASRRAQESGNTFGNKNPPAAAVATLMQLHAAKTITDDQFARLKGVQRRWANGLLTEKQARQETLQIAPNLGAH